MIKRYGFVANSSSSSFLIYGIYITEKEAKEAVEKSVHPSIVEMREKYGLNEPVETLDAIPGLFTSVGDYDMGQDGLYIGASWDSVQDDETGAEFKARVERLIKEALGEKFSCGTIEEAWYNG